MGELFEKIPQEIIDGDEHDLGDYVAYLQTEKTMLEYAPRGIERLDSPDDLRKIIQTPQLTLGVREQILTELRNGEYPENAAAMAGVPTRVWREWMAYAVRGLEPFHGFWRECFVAEARAQSDCNRILRQSEAGAKYLLERRFSRPSLAEDPLAESPQWRKQTTQELVLADKNDEENSYSVLKPKDRVKAISRIAAALAKADALDGEFTEITDEKTE